MSLFISIIGILITILFVIGTHESAHFIMARMLGVRVLRFSIGFGKSLFSWHDRLGTEYVIALIPLGGYVKMLDETEGVVPPDALPYAYNRQPFYKKLLIVLAGPAANILCAFVLYWFIFMMGFVIVKPIIGNITPDSIAAKSGLTANQEITRVDHHTVFSWTGVLLRFIMHVGDQDHLILQTESMENKKEHTYSLDLATWHMNELNPDPLSSLGIVPLTKISHASLRKMQFTPLPALYYAGLEVCHFTEVNFVLFGKMLTGKLSLQSLGGPITIFESAGEALNAGWIAFIGFLAFLSVSIGIINLIPIPGLDGGHILIQCIEWIIRRPLPERYLLLLYRAGLIAILLVMVQAVVNDVSRMS